MEPIRAYYALALIAAGKGALVSVADRLVLVSEGLARTVDVDGTLTVTDDGKDKIRRRGK